MFYLSDSPTQVPTNNKIHKGKVVLWTGSVAFIATGFCDSNFQCARQASSKDGLKVGDGIAKLVLKVAIPYPVQCP